MVSSGLLVLVGISLSDSWTITGDRRCHRRQPISYYDGFQNYRSSHQSLELWHRFSRVPSCRRGANTRQLLGRARASVCSSSEGILRAIFCGSQAITAYFDLIADDFTAVVSYQPSFNMDGIHSDFEDGEVPIVISWSEVAKTGGNPNPRLSSNGSGYGNVKSAQRSGAQNA